MRLNAFLAKAGVASRRQSDELIKSGKVLVNGRHARLNDEVTDNDTVEIGGTRVILNKDRYILLNKPAGYITTLSDEKNRRKVIDLIDIPERVVPVGRLDYDTTGALLLTNEGRLAHKLTHPSFEIDKVYEAAIEGTVTEEILNKLSIGVELADGMTAPAKVKKIAEDKVELTIHEGRKHQVKRMFLAVGLKVLKLHRSRFGPLDLAGLRSGEWRDLTDEEIAQLKS
jgi:23S rRNA pseudouridine2605 synthase